MLMTLIANSVDLINLCTSGLCETILSHLEQRQSIRLAFMDQPLLPVFAGGFDP